MVIIAGLQREIISKTDASIGLLTNVPKAILDELGFTSSRNMCIADAMGNN